MKIDCLWNIKWLKEVFFKYVSFSTNGSKCIRLTYKKYNNWSKLGFGLCLSDWAVRKANLCASWHTAGTLTVP